MPGTGSNAAHRPVWVIFNNTVLGYTAEGEITARMQETWVDQVAHQTGAQPINAYHKGGNVEIDVNLIEVDNWDLWPIAFPVGTKQQDTATPLNTRFTAYGTSAGNFIGTKASSVAAQLVLRPQDAYTTVSAETQYDLVIPLAFVKNVGDIPFGIDVPNQLALTFGALLDATQTDGSNSWFRGLETPGTGAWADV